MFWSNTMKYWLNLFTWSTWQEFEKAGSSVSGFRKKRWRTVQRMKPNDILICYMTGISRFFAVLEVTGEPYEDDTPIWNEADFSSRVPVRVLFYLPPEHAIPVKLLKNELSYFQDLKTPHAWSGHFRGSPAQEKSSDAEVIIRALEDAASNPVERKVDPRKLHRQVNIYHTKSGSVSIPENDIDEAETQIQQQTLQPAPTHEEIQWLLLYVAQEMGLDMWVANNDKGRSFGEHKFSDLPNLRDTLPVQFDQATNRTIQLIDVLWLQGNSIIAAFEVEHTSAVYSGLLRMADLITMQPNIKIPLFIVAPDERQEKVEREINRPVFARALNQSLPEICRYIPYSALRQKVQSAEEGGFLRYLRPDFIDEIAESVQIEDY
jgi:predicted RNA-binding protein